MIPMDPKIKRVLEIFKERGIENVYESDIHYVREEEDHFEVEFYSDEHTRVIIRVKKVKEE